MNINTSITHIDILWKKKEKLDGKIIIKYETELSKLNRKTLIIKDFKEYIKRKVKLTISYISFLKNIYSENLN